jgi:hypothetical protein
MNEVGGRMAAVRTEDRLPFPPFGRSAAWFLAGCLLVALPLDGCSDGGGGLPSFNDIPTAPAPIQMAARAVVRIETAGGQATGSFISPSGRLMTNNHVLGYAVCPVEGCYAQLTLLHQKGELWQASQTVFVLPVAVDVGLDLAVVQVFYSEGGIPFESPDFLTLSPSSPDARSLVGTHVTLVGHPEGDLKKWTDGVVADASGDWFTATAFSLPGNSGSPVLDDAGAVVGLIHRGPSGEDLISGHDVNVYSIGTALAPIAAALATPDTGSLLSVRAPANAADVVENDLVYLDAHVGVASIIDPASPASPPTLTSVMTLLGQACDTALGRQDFKSPDDLTDALGPCYDAMTWIDCRADEDSGDTVSYCPVAADLVAWSTRFQAINQLWLAMNGQPDLYAVSFAIARLQSSKAEGLLAGAASLQALLGAVVPLLDFHLANYLAAFGLTTYGGVSLPTYVQNYPAALHYELQGSYVAATAGWLYQDGAIARTALLSLLSRLRGDGNLSIGDRLYVEDFEYSYGAY